MVRAEEYFWVSARTPSRGTRVVGGLATILVLPVLAILRGVGERADVIEGKGCGCPAAPCAGQGLPNIDLVDATPRR